LSRVVEEWKIIAKGVDSFVQQATRRVRLPFLLQQLVPRTSSETILRYQTGNTEPVVSRDSGARTPPASAPRRCSATAIETNNLTRVNHVVVLESRGDSIGWFRCVEGWNEITAVADRSAQHEILGVTGFHPPLPLARHHAVGERSLRPADRAGAGAEICPERDKTFVFGLGRYPPLGTMLLINGTPEPFPVKVQAGALPSAPDQLTDNLSSLRVRLVGNDQSLQWKAIAKDGA
jgi:hypothetical protein